MNLRLSSSPCRYPAAVATVVAVLALFPSGRLAAQATPPPATPPAHPDETVVLQPFEVITDQGTRGYGTTNALGGTRVNAPVANTPQSVISLNQEFLKDINPTNFADALRFVSGISKVEGEYSGSVSIRGIQTGAVGFRDAIGDNVTGIHGISLPDPIEAERLEVIKGPAGALYGSHGFGGVINRVSKRPLDHRRTEVGAEYTHFANSEGFYRGYVDSTGPINAEKTVLYRVLAAYQDGTNHQHGTYKKQTFIAMLDWRLTSSTTVWVRARDSQDWIFNQQDLWTDSQRAMPFGYLPRDAYVGNYYDDDAVDSVEAQAFEVGATHSFDLFQQRWNARLLGRYNEGEDQRRTYISSGSIFFKNGAALKVGTADMTTNNATWAQAAAAGYDDIRENILRRDLRDGVSDSYSLNFDLTGTVVVGPTKHTLLLYAGQSDGESAQHRFRENWIAPKPSVFTKTSLPPTQVLDGRPQTLANEWTTTNAYRHNFALQDNVAIFDDRLILLGAMRYDSGTTRVFDNRLNVRLPADKANHWTPTYGIVGKPREGLSLFYLHSETFQPQGGVNQSGERLRPLIGDNDEVGLKVDMYRNRLVMTGSYFNMEQENSFLKIINPDGSFDFTQVPSSLSKGYELDVAFQPVDSVTLMLAYQWIDAKTQSGLAVRGVPQGGTYKAVGKYTFLNGRLKGLNLGATYEHINDSRFGDAGNNYRLPGYDLIGLFGSFRWNAWRFQLNVENLSDEWYVAGATAQQFMRGGPPRQSKFSVSRTF
ncbi:MAG: TonB-dependent receptor plug domain-containing protein [Opitutaceae bacterium]